MEYYFGNSNYNNDHYLKSAEGYDGWIDLNFINNFPRMKRFHLSLLEVFEMMKFSTVVEVD